MNLKLTALLTTTKDPRTTQAINLLTDQYISINKGDLMNVYYRMEWRLLTTRIVSTERLALLLSVLTLFWSLF